MPVALSKHSNAARKCLTVLAPSKHAAALRIPKAQRAAHVPPLAQLQVNHKRQGRGALVVAGRLEAAAFQACRRREHALPGGMHILLPPGPALASMISTPFGPSSTQP